MQKLYMAYGSNLNLEQMKRRCPNAEVVGTAELKNWRLRFRGFSGSAVATIEPAKGFTVPVLVWRITPKDERALDVYEGFPRLYIKRNLPILLEGRLRRPMVYVMMDRYPYGSPGSSYLRTIMEGYANAGFDLATLSEAVQIAKGDD